MTHPLLYLSPYFERNRSEYYEQLFSVSARGTWIAWLRYFLQGVADQAQTATGLAEQIIDLGDDWHERLDRVNATRNAHRLADFIHRHVAADAKTVSINLGVSLQTAYNTLATLEEAGILVPFSGGSWARLYIATDLQRLIQDAR